MLEALSGKRTRPETERLLNGVQKIIKNGETITLERSDGETLQLDCDTEYGDKIFNALSEAEKKLKRNWENQLLISPWSWGVIRARGWRAWFGLTGRSSHSARRCPACFLAETDRS